MSSFGKPGVVAAAALMGLAACDDSSPFYPSTPASPIAKIEAVGDLEFSAVVSTVVTPSPAVRVTDTNGKPVKGVSVSFTVTAGSGSLNRSSVETDADGTATVEWRVGRYLAVNTLRAHASPLTPVVFTARPVAGPPNVVMRIDGDQQFAATGGALTTPISARVIDAFQNPVANVPVSFTVVTGGGAADPPSAVTNANGVATTRWTVGSTAGIQTLRAQSASAATQYSAYAFECSRPPDSAPCISVGELLFARSSDHQLYVTKADGTGLTKLTSEGQNNNGAWSHDGKRIAFIRFTPGQGNTAGSSDVYVMNADGSNLVRRTTRGFFITVAWSPDGKKLAVAGYPGGSDRADIYLVSADDDGLPESLLIRDGISPSWSPDGKQIVYVHGTGYYDTNEIYLINADGTGAHRAFLLPTFYNWSPSWSPDGSKIVYSTWLDSHSGVYTVNIDGSVTTPVLQSFNAQKAAWTPDGKWFGISVSFTNRPVILYVPSQGGASVTPALVISDAYDPAWRPNGP